MHDVGNTYGQIGVMSPHQHLVWMLLEGLERCGDNEVVFRKGFEAGSL